MRLISGMPHRLVLSLVIVLFCYASACWRSDSLFAAAWPLAGCMPPSRAGRRRWCGGGGAYPRASGALPLTASELLNARLSRPSFPPSPSTPTAVVSRPSFRARSFLMHDVALAAFVIPLLEKTLVPYARRASGALRSPTPRPGRVSAAQRRPQFRVELRLLAETAFL